MTVLKNATTSRLSVLTWLQRGVMPTSTDREHRNTKTFSGFSPQIRGELENCNDFENHKRNLPARRDAGRICGLSSPVTGSGASPGGIKGSRRVPAKWAERVPFPREVPLPDLFPSVKGISRRRPTAALGSYRITHRIRQDSTLGGI